MTSSPGRWRDTARARGWQVDPAPVKSQDAGTRVDALGQWLAEPAPLTCEPPTGAPTVADLVGLAERLDNSIRCGRTAWTDAPTDSPNRVLARAHGQHCNAARDALGHLLVAMRILEGTETAGGLWDRAALASWCASECFRRGDMAGMLAMLDEVNAASAAAEVSA